MKQSFFFYDLETSGLSPRDDRIMQFAGQRTDMDLCPVGEPVNILVKLTDDTLPSPGAIFTTHITPQKTLAEGITEAELCERLQSEIFTPGTIAVGYNSIRFDDEFMRHLFWRNFYDPYDWQWRDGRSRWDLLDAVRMTRALRPDGINWPVTEEGKPTNRLELITKLNGISHEAAHDALSDVTALIDVTRLIRKKQPQLYNYLFSIRDKKQVQRLINLENPQPVVYSSGRYGTEHNFTTVAYPIAPCKTGNNVLMYDLRFDLETVIETSKKHDYDGFFPYVKSLFYNRCPAVAPISVLGKDDGWQKLGLDEATVQKNLETLQSHPDFIERVRTIEEERPEYAPAIDPESALYDSFIPDGDKVRCNAVRNAGADDLADFHPNFTDERLPELLLHYKAKNYPSALSEDEAEKWETYRHARLNRQAPKFIAELEKAAKEGRDQFIIDELKLWYESLA